MRQKFDIIVSRTLGRIVWCIGGERHHCNKNFRPKTIIKKCELHLREGCVASQVESGIAMQNLKPTIDNIKRLYGDDKKKVQRETSELYKKAQISPLAGKFKAHLTNL